MVDNYRANSRVLIFHLDVVNWYPFKGMILEPGHYECWETREEIWKMIDLNRNMHLLWKRFKFRPHKVKSMLIIFKILGPSKPMSRWSFLKF